MLSKIVTYGFYHRKLQKILLAVEYDERLKHHKSFLLWFENIWLFCYCFTLIDFLGIFQIAKLRDFSGQKLSTLLRKLLLNVLILNIRSLW